eukprot:4877768-Amphidinium_carterae.1
MKNQGTDLQRCSARVAGSKESRLCSKTRGVMVMEGHESVCKPCKDNEAWSTPPLPDFVRGPIVWESTDLPELPGIMSRHVLHAAYTMESRHIATSIQKAT